MKKQFYILNLFLLFAIVSSMFLQAGHSYSHFLHEKNKIKCHHEQNNKHEVTHDHQDFNHCYICEFSLGNFIESHVFFINNFFKKVLFKNIFLHSKSETEYFKGSLFALRAPPLF